MIFETYSPNYFFLSVGANVEVSIRVLPIYFVKTQRPGSEHCLLKFGRSLKFWFAFVVFTCSVKWFSLLAPRCFGAKRLRRHKVRNEYFISQPAHGQLCSQLLRHIEITDVCDFARPLLTHGLQARCTSAVLVGSICESAGLSQSQFAVAKRVGSNNRTKRKPELYNTPSNMTMSVQTHAMCGQ